MISYDDFAKIEIKTGKILSAEKIPDTDKLLKLSVDFGEAAPVVPVTPVTSVEAPTAEVTAAAPETPHAVLVPPVSIPRQIVSGISMYFPDPSVLVGKTCMFVTNLEPRKIRGYESNGMLFAVSTPEGAFSLLEPQPVDPSKGPIPPGTRAK